MDLNLKDKTAIVTGGSRGLGRAICLGLAAEGAKVCVNYSSNVEAAEDVVAQIETTHGSRAIAVQANVTDADQVENMFEQASNVLGPVDMLINNAGVWPQSFVADMSEEQWDTTLDINLKGPFLTCRAAVRRWLDGNHKGRIVNISSQAAFYGSTTGHADYASSKAGLITFTKSLAREVAANGIHVNAVSPGLMRTGMAYEAIKDNEQKYIDRIPLGRVAEPEEMAHMVVFLCSERADYITGATIDVNGGMVMR